MFCKWCGTSLRPGDIRCPGCRREQPPLSLCGGFYDLAPEARSRVQPMPPAREPGVTRQTPNTHTPWTAVALGAALILLLGCTVALVWRGHDNSRLEWENRQLEQELAQARRDIPMPGEVPPETSGQPVTLPTEPETTPEETETETTQPETEPSTQPETPSFAEAQLRFILDLEGARHGRETWARAQVDGAETEVLNAAPEKGPGDWQCTYTSPGDGSYAQLEAEVEDGWAEVSYGITNVGPNDLPFGAFDQVEVVWEYRIKTPDAWVDWRELPETLWTREGPQETKAQLNALDIPWDPEDTVYLRCTITRYNTQGGSATFVVSNILVSAETP